ncbi:hypothetical protein AB1N83_002506 [Pleurotus pulmonarius]
MRECSGSASSTSSTSTTAPIGHNLFTSVMLGGPSTRRYASPTHVRAHRRKRRVGSPNGTLKDTDVKGARLESRSKEWLWFRPRGPKGASIHFKLCFPSISAPAQ